MTTSSGALAKRFMTKPTPTLPAMFAAPAMTSQAAANVAGMPQRSITPGMWTERKETWKPHIAKLPAISQKRRSRIASLPCSRQPGTATARGRCGNERASGSAKSAIAPSVQSAATQPCIAIAIVTSGASTSWPAGPPAPMTPLARPRSSAAVRRLTSPIRSALLATAVPAAETTSIRKTSASSVWTTTRSAVAAASRHAPPAITRAGPKRRASASTAGSAAPAASWPKAAASPIAAMPSPVAVLSGDRNIPNDARLPEISAVSAVAAAVSRHVAALMPSRSGSGRRGSSAACTARGRAPRQRTRGTRRARCRGRATCCRRGGRTPRPRAPRGAARRRRSSASERRRRCAGVHRRRPATWWAPGEWSNDAWWFSRKDGHRQRSRGHGQRRRRRLRHRVGERHERLLDASHLRRRDERGEQRLEARLGNARDDVLPAVRLQEGVADLLNARCAERIAPVGDEVAGVGVRLRLQDPVDRADERDQVVDRSVAFARRQLRVLAVPLELVEDGVLRLLAPVEQEHVLPQ